MTLLVENKLFQQGKNAILEPLFVTLTCINFWLCFMLWENINIKYVDCI